MWSPGAAAAAGGARRRAAAAATLTYLVPRVDSAGLVTPRISTGGECSGMGRETNFVEQSDA